ncbi:MAG TPA: C39 family peptidase [Chthoniobacteraceae bacterium]|nr:C39 family peptidase [Chthoniobacteraceae bacterium]
MFFRTLLSLCLLGAGAAFAAPLDPLITDANLWSMTPANFDAASKELGFRWVSQAHDSARAATKEMTALGLPAVEAIARFDNEKLKQFTVEIYARGDAGSLTKETYDALVRNAVETLNRATGVKFTVRGKDPANAVKADGLIWTTPQAQYLLEYSATREMKTRDIAFRAEFVRLELTPPAQKSTTLSTATTTTQGRAKFNGPQHVTRDAASGDVFVADVPMVDQGRKGYCVVAATERVMRYYGAQVDSNELAQIANSDAAGGTSYSAMFAALKKVSARLKVRVKQLEESNVKGIGDLVKDYNRVAKKTGAAALPELGQSIDMGDVYGRMQFAALKESRVRGHAALGRFEREVQQHIDQGIPLLWSVELGFVTEPGIPQHAGGHMRLIIGYNTKTSEVIFTDSWGAGHEKKRMAMEDGWAITTGIAAIEPL